MHFIYDYIEVNGIEKDMTHIYKLQSMLSDLFIYKITDKMIVYEVRDKESGRLLEPRRESPYTITGNGKLFFDGRDIAVETAQEIVNILNS